MSRPDPWPLRHLTLRTPRLELRPDDDAGLLELVAVSYAGVHPPDRMPFVAPWTDADPRDMGRNTLQYHWQQRAALAPDDWTVHLLVRHAGRVIGVQSLGARRFGALREVHTGSWLGMAHQGRGFGTEMRAAVLMLAFDHLGASSARSGAYTDNPASLRVSAKLGYTADGTETHLRRGEPATETRLRLTRDGFTRPGWALAVDGLDRCRALLGAGDPGQSFGTNTHSGHSPGAVPGRAT